MTHPFFLVECFQLAPPSATLSGKLTALLFAWLDGYFIDICLTFHMSKDMWAWPNPGPDEQVTSASPTEKK
jgi:hypothetical protein